MWLIAAVLSALFAGITAILAKCGIKKTDSDVATGASWLCYFKALSIGDVNKVVAIDKSSTVLTVLLAIILFHETDHLAVKLIVTVLLGIGVILMVEKKAVQAVNGNTYIIYAAGSAVFAALTSILAKIGISGVESNLGTAIRTIVVLVMAWVMVAVKGKMAELRCLDKREMLFIGLSGIATGASWFRTGRALFTRKMTRHFSVGLILRKSLMFWNTLQAKLMILRLSKWQKVLNLSNKPEPKVILHNWCIIFGFFSKEFIFFLFLQQDNPFFVKTSYFTANLLSLQRPWSIIDTI